MKARIGVGIGYDAVRAVVLRGEEILWAGEVGRDSETELSDVIVTLLSDAPLPRRSRPALAAAIGPHACQLKLVEGLPPVEDADVLAAIVHERPSAFFLQNGSPLRTTGMRVVRAGSGWIAAIEEPYVEGVRLACAALRVKLAMVAPAAVVLPFAVSSKEFFRADGPVTLLIRLTETALASVRRLPSPPESSTHSADPVPALNPLGERAERFADAYGAAIAPLGDLLTLGPAGDVPWSRRRFRTRCLPPALVAGAAMAAMLISPVMPLVVARTAESSLRTLHASEEWRLASTVHAELQRVTSVLTEIDRFAGARAHHTRLLAELARALPDSTAIEQFAARDGEVKLVAVAPKASSVVAALRTVPGLASLAVVGDVTRAFRGGAELDRITVTFEHSGSTTGDSAAEEAE